MQKEKQKNNIKLKYFSVPKYLENHTDRFVTNLSVSSLLKKYISKTSINEFEINFLSKAQIKALNIQYRNIPSPTDVLSFNLGIIGEVDVCIDVIKHNAKNVGVDFLEELDRCIVHGILHILGFDHTSKFKTLTPSSENMFVIQEKLLSKCHIK